MLEIVDLAKRYGPVVALDGATFNAATGPHRRLPRTERRRQDDDDALHLRAGPAGPRGRSDGRASRRRSRCTPAIRVHAGTARPVSADARRRAAQLLRPAARALRQPARMPRRLNGSSGWACSTGAKSKLEELSHGNQQRVQLATALVTRPRAARARRTVLRTRPDRNRDHDRGRPASGRQRASASCSRATSSTSSRTSARTS